jgi:geranylgeranyl reductase family protein
MKVLLVDRRAVIGKPVRCAEYIPKLLLREVKLEDPVVVQPVRGMKTVIPGVETREIRAPGFIIHRDLFDQALARTATRAGAKIHLSTRAVGRDQGGVLLQGPGSLQRTVRASVIIGADGPQSRAGRWIGSVNRNMIAAIQVRVPLSKPLEDTEVYFHRDFYGGYGWLFPKGGHANVGLGIRPVSGRTPNLRKCLDGFLGHLTGTGRIKNTVLGWFSGWIPAAPLRKMTHENVLLAGDAAGQTHPITGAGVAQAVIAGRMVGIWAARSVEKGDPGLIRNYEEEWRDLYGESQERAYRRRQLLEREWDRLEHVIRHCWIAFREYYE